MNKIFQSQGFRKTYGAFGAIRVTLMGFMLNISLAAYSQSGEGLAAPDQLSTFNEMQLPGNSGATEKYAYMTALWEMDMSKAGGGDGINDPNQNNHNIFVIDDIVYVYVEKYQSPGETITLRRFNASTGEALPDLQSDFPGDIVNTFHQRYVMSDDAGHIAVVGLMATTSDTRISLFIHVYDRNFEYITTINPEFEDTEIGHHFQTDYEWLGMNGDLLSGDFQFSIGCWHFWGNTAGNAYFPSRCKLIFSKGATLPEIEITRYDSGDYTFDTRTYASSGSTWKGMFYVAEIDETHHIAQGFGTTDNPMQHSPLLLYKDNGELHTVSAQGEYPMLNQTSVLSNPDLSYADTHCFGAFPVKVEDETFLVLPYKYNSDDGTIFKVAHWNDISDFSSLKPLWQFPEHKYPYPPAIYQNLRPKIIYVPATAATSGGSKTPAQSQATTVYAYMPGSILGVYRISLADEPIASGIVTGIDNASRFDFIVQDKILAVSHVKKPIEIEILTMSGVTVYAGKLLPEHTENLSLRHLDSGVYVLMLDGIPHKIYLK